MDLEDGLPEKLREEEARLLKARNATLGGAQRDFAGRSGVAVSGGGIRSATFALGVFQALAKSKFLRHIDYLSTVSGGGYFGAFYAGLFARETEARVDPWPEIEAKLAPDSAELRYLRENGGYLAPAGSRDFWLALAVLLRNWIAIQILIAAALIPGFAVLELLPKRSPKTFPIPVAGLSAWLADAASSLFGRQDETVKGLIAAANHWGLQHQIWLSPCFVLPAIPLVLFALPLIWAYWLVGYRVSEQGFERSGDGKLRRFGRQLWRIAEEGKFGMVFVLALIAAVVVALGHQGQGKAALLLLWIASAAFAFETIAYTPSIVRTFRNRIVTFASFALSVAVYLTAFVAAHSFACSKTASFADLTWATCVIVLLVSVPGLLFVHSLLGALHRSLAGAENRDQASLLDEEQFARHNVSLWLKTALIVTGIFLAIALLHTAARTLYVHFVHDSGKLLSVLGASFASITALMQRMKSLFANNGSKRRPSWLTALAINLAGLVTLGLLLLSLDVAGVWIVWGEDLPVAIERSSALPRYVLHADDASDDLVVLRRIEGSTRLTPSTANPPPSSDEKGDPDFKALITIATLIAISLILGWSTRFLNDSGHQPLYSARLTRAYLGASNKQRVSPTKSSDRGAARSAALQAATQVIPGDDILLETYYRSPKAESGSISPYDVGAPLHIINITINETIDGRSHVQQADRKGLGLALHPCGLSAGVRHHALLRWDDPERDCEVEQGEANYCVFAYEPSKLKRAWRELRKRSLARSGTSSAPKRDTDAARKTFAGERLTIGQWIGISGAAFSTGLGFRTSIGASLLAGLANIRLGYWWSSGVARDLSFQRLIGAFFWVHHYLRREFLARFPGTANKLWYLSDGGHFENMGAYELIRRRLELIIVIDAEADPEYEFEGLGNLVRKARIDFGAEIRFLDRRGGEGRPTLAAVLRPDLLGHVGLPSELARGTWELDDAVALAGAQPAAKAPALKEKNDDDWSLAHAALAEITYADASTGYLLYIKPTLTGDEPADVIRYHAEQPAFPQQTTLDQFFDEAQWESYRQLGQHIGEQLFPRGDPRSPVMR